jgi:hypothetical protein
MIASGMSLTLEIPDSLATGRSAQDVGRELLEIFAAESYKVGKMSMRQVRELLGHESRWDTEKFLGERDALNSITAEEVVTDATTAARFSERDK